MPRDASRNSSQEESLLDMTGPLRTAKNVKGKTKRLEDGGESQSQATGTQKAVEKLSNAEFSRKVADMVRYILFADRKKVGIKRADLIKNVMKEHSRAFSKVFDEASKQLNKIFGFDIVQMETEDGKAKGYILINALDYKMDDLSDSLLDSTDESSKMALLLIILSMIFMNEGVITDAVVWYVLKKFGVYKDRNHKVFGDVDKLINQEFVKQNYLERTKVIGPEGPTFRYHFGGRSRREISRRKILEFISEIYGTDSIEAWKTQYQEVLESEQEAGVKMTQP